MTAPANRLASASSAYLKSAAHQPVGWYPWGDEAFARARVEDKPLLLDIGAVWCHWCHVIDRESYENPDIAAIINAHYVPVKVDRDERPDVDVRYQHAVSAITGQGGWPLTAFLTPDGKVFFGGTYFPPDAAGGRPGFKQVLLAIAEFYRTKRDQAHAYAEDLYRALHRLGDARSSDDQLTPQLVDAAAADVVGQFDPRHGGFGQAPKFPHASAVELLLRRADRTRDREAMAVVTRTLEGMGRGGVYDQLGGGFHRYSVDASWTVPHFEKMLYDNAGLLQNYVHAYAATARPLFREVALGILDYVTGTLADRERGGFYTSQDADISLDDDGDYYTWTEEEAAAALPAEELDAVRLHYHLEGPGEMHHDTRRHVFFVDKEPDEIATLLGRTSAEVRDLLDRGRRRLLEVRAGRPVPFVDRTVYAGWNGMMISAFLAAARGLGHEAAGTEALRALERILRDAYVPGRGIRHVVSGTGGAEGLLDDQVHVAQALLDAYEHTGEPRYVRIAEDVMAFVLAGCRAPSGAFYDVARASAPGPVTGRGTAPAAGDGGDSTPTAGRETLPAPLALPYIPLQDSPTPSGNGVAVLVLERLAVLTGEARYREASERALRATAPGALEQGLYAATLALALETHLRPPLHVVVVGSRDDPRTRALHAAALGAYRHGTIVHLHDPSAGDGHLPAPVAALAGTPDGAAHGTGRAVPRAYACTATECAPPAGEPEALRETILTFGRAAAT